MRQFTSDETRTVCGTQFFIILKLCNVFLHRVQKYKDQKWRLLEAFVPEEFRERDPGDREYSRCRTFFCETGEVKKIQS